MHESDIRQPELYGTISHTITLGVTKSSAREGPSFFLSFFECFSTYEPSIAYKTQKANAHP